MRKFALLFWLNILIILVFNVVGQAQQWTLVSQNTASPRQSVPLIQATPETALVDEIVSIRVTKLIPQQVITVRATMLDRRGRKWQSQADFIANQAGEVDLSKQSPKQGSYLGIDAMGLFWSMDLLSEQDSNATTKPLNEPRLITVEVLINNQTLASTVLTRQFMASEVKIQEVKDNGLVGRFFQPAQPGPRPGILVLGGSEGGLAASEQDAALLASHGYATLALAYFGAEGLSQTLDQIPIEYLKKGLDWLATHKSVDRSKLAVFGGSKGGELALLLASLFPELKAVVAYVPSNVVWQGIGDMGPGTGSSWTYQNQPIPYVVPQVTEDFMKQDFSKSITIGPIYLEGLKDKAAVEKATIAVEKINGPVLLLSGKDDQLWPSTLMAEMIIARLRQYQHRFRYQHLCYENAGHVIGRWYAPTMRLASGGKLVLGGTPEGNAQAQANSWPKVLQFLTESLSTEGRR
ncbi:MAG: acyl-CoA thioester hydrolase/BAAT C-terminal domain-containing protein [Acidobacteriota bacterium]